MNDLNLTIDYDENSSKAKELQWIYIFGDKTPEELYKQLAHSDDVSIKIELHDIDRKPYANIKITDYERDASFFIEDVGRKEAELKEAKTSEQGNGIAKRYLWSLSKLFQDVGTEKMCLITTEIGSYAWAKYGFCPSGFGWNTLRDSIELKFHDNKKQIRFRQKNYDLLDDEVIAIDKILKSSLTDLPNAFPQLTELNRVICEIEGKQITVGKALLIDISWVGVLPIDENHPSFKRFKAYTAPVQERLQQI